MISGRGRFITDGSAEVHVPFGLTERQSRFLVASEIDTTLGGILEAAGTRSRR